MQVSRRITILALCTFFVCGPGAYTASAKNLPGDPGTTKAAVRQALLRAVCEGEVNGPTCGECPSFAPDRAEVGSIKVGPFHVGAFVNPGANEAYVSLSGCDGRPAGYTGAVLLRQTNGKWKAIRYDPGADARVCLRFAYKTGTTLLVCSFQGDGAGGVFVQGIGAQYIGPAASNLVSLIVVQDTSGACFATKDIISLVGWKQARVNRDKRVDLILTITESHAKVVGDDLCQWPEPAKVVTHNIPFLFDGVKFAPAPGAAATVACLNNNEIGSETRSDYCPTVR